MGMVKDKNKLDAQCANNIMNELEVSLVDDYPKYLDNRFSMAWMVLWHARLYLDSAESLVRHRRVEGSAALWLQYPGAIQKINGTNVRLKDVQLKGVG